MKKKLFALLLVAICAISCQNGIWDAIRDLENKYADLDGRVAKLEELCKEMNTNISSLQTLVSVILTNDYIISVTPITKDGKEIGYVITFAIHEPITIYHGQNGADGKDGENGKNGEDGVSPIIGVAQDEVDHAYYWTLNGEWLLDVNGNRIPLTSRDGKDGQDGQDGKDGVNGITPQLKIENGYWFVSTDNGTTWTQLGKAVGENGKDGKDGKDGQDGEKGDSMFSSVTYDDDFVYFELANGTVLTVNKYKDDSVQIVDGAIMAEFSVSATQKVYFSQGNLWKKDVSGGVEYWFVENQVSLIGSPFTWSSNLGTNITIQNGGTQSNIWRLLTQSEWEYICHHSPYIKANVYYSANSNTGKNGVIIFPDNYQPIAAVQNVTYNIYHAMWEEWQEHGAIFFPDLAGLYENSKYWLSSYNQYGVYYIKYSTEGELIATLYTGSTSSESGYVRLVKDVQ